MAKPSDRDEALKIFLRDTAEHRVEILHDDGVYRLLRCRKPKTMAYGFDIVTWPGHLAISGDMGSGLFARLPDMFEFFRQPDDGPLRINPDYWHEKLEADCRRAEAHRFSPERFRQVVVSYY